MGLSMSGFFDRQRCGDFGLMCRCSSGQAQREKGCVGTCRVQTHGCALRGDLLALQASVLFDIGTRLVRRYGYGVDVGGLHCRVALGRRGRSRCAVAPARRT